MKWIFVLLTAWAFLSCSSAEKATIGSNLVNPYSVARATVGAETLIFALSSAAIDEYKTGNILTYTQSADGKSTLKSAVDVPVFGTQIAVNADLKYLVAAFVGDNAQIVLFDIQTGLPVSLSSFAIGGVNSIGLPIIFSDGNEKYVSFAINSNQYGGGVQLWNITTPSQPRRVLSLPNDLSTATEGNSFGYTSPVYVASESILIAFPSNAPSSVSGFPVSAEGFLAGLWDKATGDARAFSAAAFDLNKLAAGNSARASFVYVPLLAASNGFSGSVTSPEQRGPPLFRTHISSAIAPTTTICKTALNPAAIVVSDDATGNVFRVGGWNKIRTEWASIFADSVWTNKLATGSVSFEILASTSDMAPLSGFAASLLAPMLVESGTQCFPAWLRVESRASGEAVSRSWLQWNTLVAGKKNGDDINNNIDVVHNLREKELSTRGVVGAASSGGFVSAVSISVSNLLGMKYNSETKTFDAL